MVYITTLIQIIVALGILNVWLLRTGKATAYRGKNATTLKQEFAAYGLPGWMFYLVGLLKVSAAIAILVGFVMPSLIALGASIIAVLMFCALAMHLKVQDPPIKSLPAGVMLILSLFLVFA